MSRTKKVITSDSDAATNSVSFVLSDEEKAKVESIQKHIASLTGGFSPSVRSMVKQAFTEWLDRKVKEAA